MARRKKGWGLMTWVMVIGISLVAAYNFVLSPEMQAKCAFWKKDKPTPPTV